MESEGMTVGEKQDKSYLDIAVLAAQQNEMSKRLDDSVRSIEVLNHNSTGMKVNIAKLASSVDRNSDLIENMKSDLTSNFKTWITILGLFLSVMMFVINYYKT